MVEKSIQLAEELRPGRDNLAHGQLMLHAETVTTIREEVEGSSDTVLPPTMQRRTAKEENNETALSEEELEPIASKCSELVGLISRCGMYFRSIKGDHDMP